MLTTDMSGDEIAAIAASLRGTRPDLAKLLDTPTPANIASVNSALAVEAVESKSKVTTTEVEDSEEGLVIRKPRKGK